MTRNIVWIMVRECFVVLRESSVRLHLVGAARAVTISGPGLKSIFLLRTWKVTQFFLLTPRAFEGATASLERFLLFPPNKWFLSFPSNRSPFRLSGLRGHAVIDDPPCFLQGVMRCLLSSSASIFKFPTCRRAWLPWTITTENCLTLSQVRLPSKTGNPSKPAVSDTGEKLEETVNTRYVYTDDQEWK